MIYFISLLSSHPLWAPPSAPPPPPLSFPRFFDTRISSLGILVVVFIPKRSRFELSFLCCGGHFRKQMYSICMCFQEFYQAGRRKNVSSRVQEARALKHSYALFGSAVMRSRTGTSWPSRSRSAVRVRKMAPSSWR